MKYWSVNVKMNIECESMILNSAGWFIVNVLKDIKYSSPVRVILRVCPLCTSARDNVKV